MPVRTAASPTAFESTSNSKVGRSSVIANLDVAHQFTRKSKSHHRQSQKRSGSTLCLKVRGVCATASVHSKTDFIVLSYCRILIAASLQGYRFSLMVSAGINWHNNDRSNKGLG
jgi:hypothetical protein